jgi:hypothetical protein
MPSTPGYQALDDRLTAGFIEESLDGWHASGSEIPDLGRRYSEREQREREELFDQALDSVQAQAFELPDATAEREEASTRVLSGVAEMASLALDLNDPKVGWLLREKFYAVGKDLARCARRLDADVSVADILQACRNAWTAGGLQALLGEEVRLTPAVFAYSMLYPYSDNYLDDAEISRDAKLRFSARFGLRLAGDRIPAADRLETIVWQLVSLIETQYARDEYPQVYDCLLAIHGAQEDSIHQLCAGPGGDLDVLRLSVTKGGTSVLADAYLAAGSPIEAEARFAFRWGVLLQLGDDLQDLAGDRESGFVTVFSQAAELGPLDNLLNRTLHFGQSTMNLMDTLPRGAGYLKELLRRNSSSLLLRAAGDSGGLFSRAYLAELETHSPLRFAFLQSRKEQMACRLGSHSNIFEALLLD